jgi:HK97 family phage prohead protease
MKLRHAHHEEAIAAEGPRAPVGLVMRSMGGVHREIDNRLEVQQYNGPPPAVTKDAEGSPFVTRDGAMLVKRFDPEQRSAEFIASTDAVDSHGDVIDQGSWILNDYQANPIVLYGHNSRDLPIGKATSVGVVGGKLMATIKFATADANPMAEQVWKLINEGILKAVSVGFQPTDGRYEVRDGNEVFVWRSPILKEISVVPVPANPEALARMKSTFAERSKQQQEVTPPAAPAPSDNAIGTAPSRKDKNMELKDALEKIEKQTATIALSEAEVTKQAARADKAESHVRELEGKVKALETEKTALDAQTKSLAEARDAEKARAEQLEGEVIEREVAALVGVKIKPTEKDSFVELRKTNKKLFGQMIEQRSDMKLDKSVVKDAPAGDVGTVDDLITELKGQ